MRLDEGEMSGREQLKWFMYDEIKKVLHTFRVMETEGELDSRGVRK